MSNVINFPDAKARDHLKIDQALARFHASAIDDEEERVAVIDAMIRIAAKPASEAGHMRACQWLAEVWNIAAFGDEPALEGSNESGPALDLNSRNGA